MLTSSNETDCALAFSRSISTKICGWFTLKVEKRAAMPGWRLAFVGRCLDGALQGAQAGIPLVLDLQLDAAGGAQAFDGRGPEDADRGFLEGVELPPQLGGDAAGYAAPGVPCALQTATRITNMPPTLLMFVLRSVE